MAHNLATTNGETAMAFYGESPWHGLGAKLEEPATAAEAIAAASLDYEVRLAPIATIDGVAVPQRKAVVRTDSQQVLGVVGNGYVPIQNRECFGFLDAVVADGGLRYHTAGALGKGERIWLLAKLPGHLRVKGTEDITEKFLLLSSSHDGTSALRVFFTPIRVVCQNTLFAAERRAFGQGVSIVHKGDLAAKVQQAQTVLGLAQRFYDDLEGQINRLASHYPTPAQLEGYFRELYPDPIDAENTRAQNTRRELFRLYESGRGQDIYGIRRSTWAAVNAVSEYVDHHRPTRASSVEARASRRLQSQWFGSGARLKAQAWNLALAMASGN